MKFILTVFALASAMYLGGCADPLEQPGQEAAQHFQRGISGQGTLGPVDRSNDPYVRGGPSDTHP
ncbi:MAG: hypothetical protein ABJB09_01255 [Verrucomicrobiota bacterium]